MGIYEQCKSGENKFDIIYPIMYVIAITVLLIVGSLYEADVLPRNQEFLKNSVWWYGFLGIVMIGVLVVSANKLFKYMPLSKITKTHFWYISHILCYFAVTLVSPGQWPFWLAIGITWELFECYMSCSLVKKGYPITCSGMYDITANIAGIAIAMWIRSELDIPLK